MTNEELSLAVETIERGPPFVRLINWIVWIAFFSAIAAAILFEPAIYFLSCFAVFVGAGIVGVAIHIQHDRLIDRVSAENDRRIADYLNARDRYLDSKDKQ